MSLLTLRDIGKIYVSDNSVAVGIRHINLSFDRGEFVAVTGKSGSGKSTLLNVISGMDTYEEGEMLIEGQETSYYVQPDWELYREKYISFIFQDYNIIDSFTVLQNVELALMNIHDRRERRKRALELIRRVGMEKHIRQKGSKLSGGQKQRTVIARALAKDSPIILADEPTGNLDSATSKEIIELLREVSRDKLLIIVTHNFEQVEEYATRHIRIFDGSVESDHTISAPEVIGETEIKPAASAKRSKRSLVSDGFMLGRVMFRSRPKLTVFLCLLMVIGMLGVFFITAMSGAATALFEKNYMFTHVDGRLVIVRQDGGNITEEELSALADKVGAEDYFHVDKLIDEGYVGITAIGEDMFDLNYHVMKTVYGKDYGNNILGRYPEARDEVLLYLPIYEQPYYGKDEIRIDSVQVMNAMDFKVVGIKYFYDNNLESEMLFTAEGFKLATAIEFASGWSDTELCYYYLNEGKETPYVYGMYPIITVSDKVPAGKIQLGYPEKELSYYGIKKLTGAEIDFSKSFYTYRQEYFDGGFVKDVVVYSSVIDKGVAGEYVGHIGRDKIELIPMDEQQLYSGAIIASPEFILDLASDMAKVGYSQSSLFFESDKAAKAAVDSLREEGYIAVPSNTTYDPEIYELILSTIAAIFVVIVWFGVILFIALFINICSGRSVAASKDDMSIMRSMGIPVKVIRTAILARMIISLIPAYITVIGTAVVLFLTPKTNEYFMYLYWWHYLVMFAGMMIIAVRVTRKQIKKLFSASVKKAMKGGDPS